MRILLSKKVIWPYAMPLLFSQLWILGRKRAWTPEMLFTFRNPAATDAQ
jgi:hypothetical protein